jgi:hypothetical protein
MSSRTEPHKIGRFPTRARVAGIVSCGVVLMYCVRWTVNLPASDRALVVGTDAALLVALSEILRDRR